MSMGGKGSFALPGPNISPRAQDKSPGRSKLDLFTSIGPRILQSPEGGERVADRSFLEAF
jgi:hypothetical protein